MNLKLNLNNKKRGNVAVYPLIVVSSMLFIIAIFIQMYSVIEPLIWYEKLNTISSKYLFITEKYGYLNNSEREKLLNELSDSGFDINNIVINVPSIKQDYGKKINFEIMYKCKVNSLNFFNNTFSKNYKYIDIKIEKFSYSKV